MVGVYFNGCSATETGWDPNDSSTMSTVHCSTQEELDLLIGTYPTSTPFKDYELHEDSYKCDPNDDDYFVDLLEGSQEYKNHWWTNPHNVKTELHFKRVNFTIQYYSRNRVIDTTKWTGKNFKKM